MIYAFIGTTKKLSRTMFRDVRKEGDYAWLCSGRCNLILKGYNDAYDENHEPMGWGYDGEAPDLLSVGLLSVVIGLDGKVLRDGLNHIHVGDLGLWRTEVLNLYRQFTQQITSKLPDNWEITSDEIEAWVKDHKKLPACIRKQKQNQKQRKRNGKEKAKAKAKREGSVVR